MSAPILREIMHRRVTTIIVLVLLLAGCGGGGGGSSNSVATNPDSVAPPSTNPPAPTTPSNPTVPEPIVSPERVDALRFLEQATFGPTSAELASVSALGIEGYLDRQFSLAKTGYVGFTRTALVQPDDCKTQPSAPTSAASLCARDHFTLFELQRQFFANAMTGEDQLRQRVAFALSQIFVVSGTEIKHAAGMASYQNMLLDCAFDNFRELMESVTLHPVMGVYLDMVNNAKGNPARGTRPNENYARELLQLFTIGVVELNPDGTARLDNTGQPIPAYSEDHVRAYARAFTGWTYSPWTPSASHWTNSRKLVGDMVSFDTQHDMEAKQLLGVTLPAGQSAREDLEQALDSIFAHPNVGPFVATRLIQPLVTSNPSPAYVSRVAAVFDDNGRGVRGDLRSVVRAILIDVEARGAAKTASEYGRLKDPVLFMTGYLRSLGGKSDGVFLRAQAAAMGEDVFTAPSVFNYFSPLQRAPHSTLLGPEFGIFDATSSLTRIDFVYQLIYGGGAAPDDTVANSIGTSIAFGEELANADYLQVLDERLMFGKGSLASRTALMNALAPIAAEDYAARVKAVAYALGSSAQYQVQR